jgi:hypothetical protein
MIAGVFAKANPALVQASAVDIAPEFTTMESELW